MLISCQNSKYPRATIVLKPIKAFILRKINSPNTYSLKYASLHTYQKKKYASLHMAYTRATIICLIIHTVKYSSGHIIDFSLIYNILAIVLL